MATYIIGDIQGCFDSLQKLLDHIHYDPSQDRLGFCGDLVNRGPQSLDVLRFIKKLSNPMVVLGNHDFYALVLGYGLMPEDAYQHTMQDILAAPDRVELLDWLRQQPLFLQDESQTLALVHAGIPPQWTIAQAQQYANEVQQVLQSDQYAEFLLALYGDQPTHWLDTHQEWDRLRYIVNAFTRMRFCTQTGELDLKESGISHTNKAYQAWFTWRNDPTHLIFGHWASLKGECSQPRIHAIDTGCVWGGKLTAIRVDDWTLFSI